MKSKSIKSCLIFLCRYYTGSSNSASSLAIVTLNHHCHFSLKIFSSICTIIPVLVAAALIMAAGNKIYCLFPRLLLLGGYYCTVATKYRYYGRYLIGAVLSVYVMQVHFFLIRLSASSLFSQKGKSRRRSQKRQL